jgi:glycerol-3-phosphate dehydrogenase
VKVTQSEFKRLAAGKEKLKKQIQESRDEQEAAFKAHEAALGEIRVARAKEERLRQQMDLLDRRADEAIAVEERNIQELEREEAEGMMAFDGSSEESALQLSPSTLGAFEGSPVGGLGA